MNPGKDIFLEMLEIELELPTDQIIRETMQAEAERMGLQLSKSRLAELQPLAGRNRCWHERWCATSGWG